MIHLIVGNTGAGKTTYCNKLKQETNGIIFSIDQWNNTLFMPDKSPNDGLDWFLERLSRAESIIKTLILQLEETGTDSILDLGFSKFEHREHFRQFAKANKIDSQLYFIDVNKETRWERVQQRNLEKGATYEFEVSKENFDFMEKWFEKPEGKERDEAIVFSS